MLTVTFHKEHDQEPVIARKATFGMYKLLTPLFLSMIMFCQ